MQNTQSASNVRSLDQARKSHEQIDDETLSRNIAASDDDGDADHGHGVQDDAGEAHNMGSTTAGKPRT